MADEGFTGGKARIRRSAALHYKGQSYELVVPVPDGRLDSAMATHLEDAFGREHELDLLRSLYGRLVSSSRAQCWTGM